MGCLLSVAFVVFPACSTTSQGKLFTTQSEADDIRKLCAREVTPLQERLLCEETVEIVVSHDLNTGRFLQERLTAYTESEGADDVQSAPFVVGAEEPREVIRSELFNSTKRIATLIGYENATGSITCLARGDDEIALCEHAIEALAGETQTRVADPNVEMLPLLGMKVAVPAGCLREETESKVHIACYGATADVQIHTSLVDAAKRFEGIELEIQAVGLQTGTSVNCQALGADADCIAWDIAETPPMRFLASLSSIEGRAVTVLCKAPDPQNNALCEAFIETR